MRKNLLVHLILGLLVLQFILGMLASFYQEVPAGAPQEVFEKFGYIMIHVLNAALLIIFGAVFLWKVIRRKTYVKAGAIGFASLVLAYGGGVAFVFLQDDIYSLVMSVGFIGALLAYAYVAFTDAALQRKR